MAHLNVNIGNLSLKNPVLTASGTFGYGLEFADFIDLNRLGGYVVKGTTLLPRQGNDYPRMAETAQGMLNCVGLQNKGVDYFAENTICLIEWAEKGAGLLAAADLLVNIAYAENARNIELLAESETGRQIIQQLN